MNDPHSHYVDGFLLPVPKAKLDDYRRLAQIASEAWRDHGALHYQECVGDDLTTEGMRSFADAVGAGAEDCVIFAWAVFPSKEARDAANAKIMADPRIAAVCEDAKGTFDCTKMFYGGFNTLVVR